MKGFTKIGKGTATKGHSFKGGHFSGSSGKTFVRPHHRGKPHAPSPARAMNKGGTVDKC